MIHNFFNCCSPLQDKNPTHQLVRRFTKGPMNSLRSERKENIYLYKYHMNNWKSNVRIRISAFLEPLWIWTFIFPGSYDHKNKGPRYCVPQKRVLPETIMEMRPELEGTPESIKTPLVSPKDSNLGLIQLWIWPPICRKIKNQRNILNFTKSIKSSKCKLRVIFNCHGPCYPPTQHNRQLAGSFPM